MIDRTGTSQLLGRLVTSLTTLPVIVAQQNAPRPIDIQYATVNIFASNGIGWDDVTHTDQASPDLDLDETITGTRQLSVSFNFFRDNAFDYCSRFRTLLQGNVSEAYLKANGLSLGQRGQTRDLTEDINKNFEQRAQIDIDFYVLDVETLTVRSIQSLEIGGNYESGGRVTDITIEIP